jgi:hypothetical protein
MCTEGFRTIGKAAKDSSELLLLLHEEAITTLTGQLVYTIYT